MNAFRTLRCIGALLVGFALVTAVGCDNSPTRPAGIAAVRLSLNASVVAAAGAVVDATVSYTPPGGGAATILAQNSVVVTTAGADASFSLTADVATCVRQAPRGSACAIDLVVRLTRDGSVLDQSTQRISVAASDNVVPAQAVQLNEVATLRVTPATITNAEPGDSITLTATTLDRNGNAVAGRAATWSVVSGGVTVSATGVVRAVSVGAAVIRATAAGRSQDVVFTVVPPTVATLTLAPLDTLVSSGGVITLRVVARSFNGTVLTGKVFTFTSSAPARAAINTTGVITCLSTGTSTITARSADGRGGATVTATTTLRCDTPSAFSSSPSALSFDTEQSQPLPPAKTVAITNAGGGSLGTIAILLPTDPFITATLDRTTAPATLTVRPTTNLAPGVVVTSLVIVTSSTAGVAPATIVVTNTGRSSTLAGRFSGAIVNAASGVPVANASVAIRRADNSLVDQVVTGIDGLWTSNPILAGTYNVVVTATGFQVGQIFNQTVVVGPTVPVTPLTRLQLVLVSSGTGIISGTVADATGNFTENGVTLQLRAGVFNTTGTVLATATSNANGFYSFATQPNGSYTVRASKVGYADGVVIVTVVAGNVTAPVVFISPADQNVVWRFVLSWGATPSDLDAHLTGPILNSATRFQVYFFSPGSSTADPFATLDVDQTAGFGPETITITRQIPGVYRYYVNNYSGESALRASTARVDVYQGNTLVRQFFPPQQDGNYWSVFEINGTTITPLNSIGSVEPTVAPPSPSTQSIDSAAARAAAEWRSLAPWLWTKQKR